MKMQQTQHEFMKRFARSYNAEMRRKQREDDNDEDTAVDDLTDVELIRELLAREMRKRKTQTTMTNMPPTFERMVKGMGIERVAKAICDLGDGSRITEKELVEAITEHGKRLHPSMKADQAFTKVFTSQDEAGIVFRKAVQLCKDMPRMTIMPVVTGNNDVDDDDSDAIEALDALAEEQRRRSPEMSKAQAFAKVYSDPANLRLAQKERRQARARFV
jgi:hypothetical protein